MRKRDTRKEKDDEEESDSGLSRRCPDYSDWWSRPVNDVFRQVLLFGYVDGSG